MSKKKYLKNQAAIAKAAPNEPVSSNTRGLLLILTIALIVRLVYLALDQHNPFYGPSLLDPRYYHQWAIRILSGDWIGEGVFYGLPLYPFFLALCYKVSGQAIVFVKVVQLLLGIVSTFFIYKIGEKIHSATVGFLAAILSVIYGPLIFNEQIFIPESLSVPLYAVSFYFCCIFWDNPSYKKAFLCAVLLAMAVLTKAGILLFVIFFFLAMFIQGMRRKKQSALIATAFLLFFLMSVAPVTAHNIFYGKDFVWLTSHGGFNFYIGNNEKAEGVFLAPEGTGSNVDSQILDSKIVAETDLGRELKPSEVSGYWSNKAWNFIYSNPDKFSALTLRKFVLFFDAREISDVQDYVYSKQFNLFLRFPWLNFTVLGPLFLLGLIASSRNSRHRGLLYLWLLTYISSVVLFFINARYRLPMLGVMFPVAALGLIHIYEAISRKNLKVILLSAVVLLAGIALTQARLVGTNFVKQDINVGDIYSERKEYELAEKFYRAALEKDMSSAKAYVALGIISTRLGRDADAKDLYLKAIEYDSKNSQAFNNLGLWYDKAGDLEEAKKLFLKAVELKPGNSQAHNNLGMAYGKAGDYSKAAGELELSLKLNPHSERAYTNLGLVYYRLNRPKDAEVCWTKALAINPDFEEARRALRLFKSKY